MQFYNATLTPTLINFAARLQQKHEDVTCKSVTDVTDIKPMGCAFCQVYVVTWYQLESYVFVFASDFTITTFIKHVGFKCIPLFVRYNVTGIHVFSFGFRHGEFTWKIIPKTSESFFSLLRFRFLRYIGCGFGSR